jgi:hypothetical protein
MEAMTFLTSALVDRKAGDLRIETAMCKMWSHEPTWRIADEAMQVRAVAVTKRAIAQGRGEEGIPVERYLRDCRINMIFEGSSEIMRLFIAREALDPHLKVGGAIFNTQLPRSERAKAVGQIGQVLRSWYPKQWVSARLAISRNCTPICARMFVMRRARARNWRADYSTPWRGSVRSSIASNCCSRALSASRPSVCYQRDLLLRAIQDRPRRACR